MAETTGTGYARSSWIFGRLLGAVFLIAFVSLHEQILGLVGEHGIEPATELLEALRLRDRGFFDVPTLAWVLGASDGALQAMCVMGELASIALMAGVFAGWSSLAATALYLSIAHVGGSFLLFQWDALLIETGFL